MRYYERYEYPSVINEHYIEPNIFMVFSSEVFSMDFGAAHDNTRNMHLAEPKC